MKLTSYTPVLNEEFFIPIWLENVLQFSDEVVILDTGSSDNTIDIIKSFNDERIRLIEYPDKITDMYKWNEGKVRNYGKSFCTGDYVLAMDADEVITDNFKDKIKEIIEGNPNSICFRFRVFWGDLLHTRENTPDDPRWNLNLYRMWKTECLEWVGEQNHAVAKFVQPLKVANEEVHILHLHYGLGLRVKTNDNRWAEINYDNKLGYTNIVNANIVLSDFKLVYPKCLYNFLNNGEGNG